MNIRGMTGKWKHMWHSSPSPKYSTTSSGHWLASARRTLPRIEGVDLLAQPAKVFVRLGEVLAVGALPLEEVRHRVEPEPVEADVQPVAADVEHGVGHLGVVVVEVRLMGEEPVPVVLAPLGVVTPVGLLRVDEDDPGVAGIRCHRRARRTSRLSRWSDPAGTPETRGAGRRCGS